jgi:hypothetical protein
VTAIASFGILSAGFSSIRPVPLALLAIVAGFGAAILPAIVNTVRDSLKVPYAAIEVIDRNGLAESLSWPPAQHPEHCDGSR